MEQDCHADAVYVAGGGGGDGTFLGPALMAGSLGQRLCLSIYMSRRLSDVFLPFFLGGVTAVACVWVHTR